MSNMNFCYRCHKESSELSPIDENLYCLRCYPKVKKLLSESAGFNNIRCPKCSGTMTGGKASVHGTVLGFIFFGFSHQHLWFEPADGSFNKRKMLETSSSTRAAYCKKCDYVLLDV